MDDFTIKGLCAAAIGELMMEYMEPLDSKEIADLAERRAVALVKQIKTILDDAALDSITCFLRIEALVDAFYAAGLSTQRHPASE